MCVMHHLYARSIRRYRNIYQPRKTGRWSEKEDNVLLDAVKKVRQRHGQDVWIEVAKLVPHRTDRQCRERYVRVLDPTLRKGEWTPEEIDLLTKAHAEFGDNWSKISEYVDMFVALLHGVGYAR